MHELSLAERVIQIVEHAAQQSQAKRVVRVRLGIGALAHIDADTLQFCCELAARQTSLAQTEFAVSRIAGQAQCHDCAQIVELDRIGMACPRCGSYALQMQGGDEMQVLDMVIA